MAYVLIVIATWAAYHPGRADIARTVAMQEFLTRDSCEKAMRYTLAGVDRGLQAFCVPK